MCNRPGGGGSAACQSPRHHHAIPETARRQPNHSRKDQAPAHPLNNQNTAGRRTLRPHSFYPAHVLCRFMLRCTTAPSRLSCVPPPITGPVGRPVGHDTTCLQSQPHPQGVQCNQPCGCAKTTDSRSRISPRPMWEHLWPQGLQEARGGDGDALEVHGGGDGAGGSHGLAGHHDSLRVAVRDGNRVVWLP